MLTVDQIRTFSSAGWVVVPGLIAPDLVDALDDEANRLVIGTPPPTGHVGHHCYWRTPGESPVLFGTGSTDIS